MTSKLETCSPDAGLAYPYAPPRDQQRSGRIDEVLPETVSSLRFPSNLGGDARPGHESDGAAGRFIRGVVIALMISVPLWAAIVIGLVYSGL